MRPDTWMGLSWIALMAGFIPLAFLATAPLSFRAKIVSASTAVVVALAAGGGCLWGFTEASRDNCERLGFGRIVSDCREYTVTIRTPNPASKETR